MLVIHGGYWRTTYDAGLGESLAEDLAARGLQAYNLEYRRGPGSALRMLQDARSALAAIPDPGPVTVIGHSAGGQLACLLAAAEERVTLVISQAGLLDLQLAADLELSQGAVREMLADTPLDEVNPVAQWPMAARVIIFHGTQDEDVPPVIAEHASRAAIGCGQEHHTRYFDGDHFTWIDPATEQWQACVEQLAPWHFGGTR
ncbi:alpha/beta fold hydrolase [Glutamicibacter sp. MNS18]|uniref:alpha/beta fold hydrolase n=1 Tax=Glutamicibacter sp. MNS18 TaxID=2989817 RepID=UPI00223644A2|nr:alpha/beta fold hydrolase [Glutamicibacter sp. MNS18]MCW4466671.1 alpha/beta fold hydrolase [Glutamicibacter sp. MNS18]